MPATCSSCDRDFPASVGACPYCGAPKSPFHSGLVRTSSVLIANTDVHVVYSSVSDVPEALRRTLERSTKGRYSGTILIADRRGKEAIERAAHLRELEKADENGGLRARWRSVWPAFLALGIGAAGAWAAFALRW